MNNPVKAAGSIVRVRRREDVVVEQLSRLSLQTFDQAVPWREFRSFRGQRHYSGRYWSATMESLVGYESRLELANLLCEDFDPTTTWILSQPFLLEGKDGRRVRHHVPDYLVERVGGRARVIDVKPSALLSEPKIAAALDWSARMIAANDWEYVVLSEPEPVRLGNIRFLAGYRRAFQFSPVEVEAARSAITEPMTATQAVRTAAGLTAPEFARSIVLHLLWAGSLVADLSEPLQAITIVEPRS